jgi:glycosyltransferase involved in cell wall biosynthesis
MMSPKPAKILIVDQSLRDMAGHHYEYDVALFRAAAAAGVPVVIGAHAGVQRLESLGNNVRPWFQRAWYESHAAGAVALPVAPNPLLGWLPAIIRTPLSRVARRIVGPRKLAPAQATTGSGFGADVLALIRAERLGAGDHVLVHTFSIPELDDLIDLARSQRGLPLIHIIFRRDASEPTVADGPRGGIRGSLSRLAASASAVRTLRLYADTDDLARQYAALSPGLDVGVIPIPHCLPPPEGPQPPRAPGPLRIVYLGDARDEKGFHLLADLVDALAGKFFPQGRARFILQGNISVAGDNPVLSHARRRLAAYPGEQVALITEQLDLAAFHDLVRSADIVLLPYDATAYARRSSGILVQALAAGRVVVVPAQTWLARQAEAGGSVAFGTEKSLSDAVAAAVERWPELAGAARRNAAAFRAEHDAARYIAQLLTAGGGS